MNFNRLQSSSKFYIVSLFLAIAVLLFTASMTYRQIKRMQSSADRVAHTYQVNDAIGALFSHYYRLESAEFRAGLLKGNRFEERLNVFIADGTIVFDSLKSLVSDNASQLQRLEEIKALEGTLYDILIIKGDSINGEAGLTKNGTFPSGKISGTLFKIRGINDQMRAEERRLMQARKADYVSRKFLAPLTLLILAFFALFVFIASFLRIYRNKNRIRESEAFLRKVVAHTDNIVNYYEPINDRNGKINDFEIVFANECNRDFLGLEPQNMIGKKVSKIFPFMMRNGEFEELVRSYTARSNVRFERQVAVQDNKMWFKSFVSPLSKGVLAVVRNITEEEEAKRDLLALNESFKVQNSLFKDAEDVGGIGSYIWYLDDGSASISDNFYRILGYEPGTFEVSYKSYGRFVHPEDLQIYDQLGKETVGMGKSTVYNYRIITKHGDIKHLYVNGRYSEREGRPVSLGVVQDITNRIKKDEDLRLRNLELEQRNAELKSFNRVSSHDLQEPLRKIQMFISRMGGNKGLSIKDREYFQKIEKSASRMRTLIDNLLNYSKIDSNHEHFEKVDLNTILNKAKEELSGPIEETGATLAAEKLPVINGIYYQMEQLFDNLISNALKYRSQNVRPHIIIQSEKVHRKQIPETFFKTTKHFYKLTFADNGIGFEQNQADKIFEVFQRLHLKSQYSGTGIGLAICKKIIENHYGFIYTKSEPGKGSVFVVYLPA